MLYIHLVISLSNSKLQSRRKCPFFPFFFLPSVQVVMFKSPPVRHWLLWPFCCAEYHLNGLPPGCDAQTVSRDCSVQNITGNHLNICVLEEFLIILFRYF